MNFFFRFLRRSWIYFVFAFAMVIFFTVRLFPERMLSSFISERIGAAMPGYLFQAERTDLTFPAGLGIHKAVLTLKTGEPVSADYLYIRPTVSSFFTASKSFYTEMKAFGGNAVIDASLKDRQTIVKADADLKKIDLSMIPKSVFKGYGIKGIIDADLKIEMGEKGYDGVVSARASKAWVELPVISGLDLGGAEVDLNCLIKANTAEIKKCVFSAGPFQGEVKGRVILAFPVEKSTLNLTVDVNRKEGGKDLGAMLDSFFRPGTGKTLILTGTAANPKYSLK